MHSQGGSGGAFTGPADAGSSSTNDSYCSSHYYNDNRYMNYGSSAAPRASSSPRGDGRAGCFVFSAIGLILGSLWFFHDASERLEMGLNYSRVFQPSVFYYRKMQVRSDNAAGIVVYSLASLPPLNKKSEWSHTHDGSLDGQSHQEWALWMNKGSGMEIDFDIGSSDSNLVVAVLRGLENFKKWRSAPQDSDPAVYYRNVHGKGKIHFYVDKDGDYYFAFGNTGFSSTPIMVQLKADMKLYSHTGAVSKCDLRSGACDVNLSLFRSTYVLLTAPDVPQGQDDVWDVKISYKAQWVSPLLVYGSVFVVVLLVWMKTRRSGHSRADEDADPGPLLKEDQTKENVDASEEKQSQSACCVCLDARKDSFFDPCGHSATCYSCGCKIKDARNQCPICRRPISQVRRIYDA